MKLAGRAAVITGASQGFGRAIAERFVTAGSSVLLCARGEEALDATVRALQPLAAGGQKVLGQVSDVSRPVDMEALFRRVEDEFGGLDVLVNNAGVYGPKGMTHEVAWDDWVRAVEINLYGMLLPIRAATPLLIRRGAGKIVNLSGGGATSPLPRLSAYAASKAAVVRLTETLAHELQPFNIDVNAVAPGALNTRLLDEVLAAGPAAVGEDFYARALRQSETGGAPLEKGAELCVYLASEESDGITGRLLSALWDPWPLTPAHREAVRDSDIYTLRRIVPADRGQDWGG